MNVGNASPVNSYQPLGQAQVTVMKKQQEMEKQNIMSLIETVGKVAAPARASGGNPPGVGQNLNVVA